MGQYDGEACDSGFPPEGQCQQDDEPTYPVLSSCCSEHLINDIKLKRRASHLLLAIAPSFSANMSWKSCECDEAVMLTAQQCPEAGALCDRPVLERS